MVSAFIASAYAADFQSLDIQAEAVVVMNAHTGRILFEKIAICRCAPASLTKIATALYTLERGRANLEKNVVVQAEALTAVSDLAKIRSDYRLPAYYQEPDGTHIDLKLAMKCP